MGLIGLVVAVIMGIFGVWWGRAQVTHWMTVHERSAPDQMLQPTEICPTLRICTIASEDRGFYRHHGFDFTALHRALRKDIRSGSLAEGGSTISMQAARYAFGIKKKTISRKLREAFLTVGLESLFTKEQILDIYLSTADYGFRQIGVRAAARFYFGKEPIDLNLAESVFLARAVVRPPRTLRELALTLHDRSMVCDRIASFVPLKYSESQLEEASVEPGKTLFRNAVRKVEF
jgi:membrane peptidoglycan carboxypeptidase